MLQFERSVSLNVGPASGDGIKISRLRISFNIKKTNDAEPNTAEIQVFNLSASTREQLDKNLNSKTKNKVFLNAGYVQAGGEKVLFIGDVTHIEHKFTRPDITTTIRAQDGQKDLNSVKTSLSFPENTSAKTILETLLKLYPQKNDLANLSFTDVIFKSGFSFSGLAKDGIKKITDSLNLDFSIQNDEIRIIPLGGNNQTSAVLLSSTTGLLNSPERINDDVEKSKGKEDGIKSGWKFTSLLQPLIIPGGKVAVTSETIPANTFFTAVSVEHHGDSHTGDFQTITEVKDV